MLRLGRFRSEHGIYYWRGKCWRGESKNVSVRTRVHVILKKFT
jgi:hypothetical protein